MDSMRRNPNDEWNKIIQAQAQNNKKIAQQQKQLNSLSKKLYKEQLDRHINFKKKQQESQSSDHHLQREFFQNQNQAMRDHQNQIKVQNRDLNRIIANHHLQQQQTKIQQRRQERQAQVQAQNQRLQAIRAQLQNQKLRQKAYKQAVIKSQLQNLRQKQWQKEQIKKQEQESRLQERELIAWNMNKQLRQQNQYREFYDNKLQDIDRKLLNFNGGVLSQTDKWNQVERMNIQAIRASQKRNFQLQIREKQIKASQKKEMMEGLQKQIQQKEKQKQLQKIDLARDHQYQRRFAEQTARLKQAQVQKKARQRENLFNSYQNQLQQRNDFIRSQLGMNEKELKMNKAYLSDSDKPINFPGVPGAHNLESPLKHNIGRAYNTRSTEDLYAGVDQQFKQNAAVFYGSPVNKISTPYDIYQQPSSKRTFFQTNPSVHNPITNPLGASIPRVLPGQRIAKGNRIINSKLQAAGTSIINQEQMI